MPWSNQSGGGWNGNSGGNQGGPWGQGPKGPNNAGGPTPPDLEDLLKNTQDKLKTMVPGGGSGGLLAFGLLAIVGVWLLTGFFRVEEGYEGVVLRFGEINRTETAGLNYALPYPIETVRYLNISTSRSITIGQREAQTQFVSDTSDAIDKIEAAIKNNENIASTSPEDNLVLAGDRKIIDISYTVNWNIKNSGDYLFNIRQPEATVRAVAESAMREVIGLSEAEPLLSTERGEAALKAKELMQKTLDSYKAGILIQAVNIQHSLAPRGLVRAMYNDANAARNDQETLIQDAQAYASKVVPEAEGNAKKLVNASQADKERLIQDAIAEVATFNAIRKEYEKAPEIVRQRLYLENMQKILSGKKKVLLDTKAGGNVLPLLPLNQLMDPKSGGQAR